MENKLADEQHTLLSALRMNNIDINAAAKTAWAAGIDEEWLYVNHYVFIDKDGIYPYEDIWDNVPNYRKNEILTEAYEYKTKGLFTDKEL